MSKNTNIDKEAKEKIIKQIDTLGEVTIDKIMELLQPYYRFDVRKLRNQALRRAASGIMRTYKDKKGMRNCYSYKSNEGKSKYVNIDESEDLEALRKIEIQLQSKAKSLNISMKKIRLRRKELEETQKSEVI